MSLVRLEIKGISYSQTQSGAYALVLKEVKGKRTLPIVIGAFEAQAIAIALEKEIKPPRPLIHDLFKNFSDRFEIKVKQVIIHKLVDGVFFSSLICEKDKIEQIIDSRTSDAVALATRFDAPIFTYENILEKAGIYLNPLKDDLDLDQEFDENDYDEDDYDDEEDEQALINSLNELVEELKEVEVFNEDENLYRYSLEELEKKLSDAVEDEDYEVAAQIRDEIDNRK